MLPDVFIIDYTNNRTYFGATVGRVANRIGNGKFVIDGKEYNVPVNNGPNALHGGINGFDKVCMLKYLFYYNCFKIVKCWSSKGKS